MGAYLLLLLLLLLLLRVILAAVRQSQLPTPTDAPPRPAPPMHGDLVEQLDFLAARQVTVFE